MRSLADGHPAMHPMLVARAAAMSDSGRFADAIRDADKAIGLFPESGRAYLERAIAKEGLKEPAASLLGDFKRAGELDARFTQEYELALARLEADRAGRGTRDAGMRKGGRFSAFIESISSGGPSSDLAFAAVAAGLVLAVAAAAFVLSRRS